MLWPWLSTPRRLARSGPDFSVDPKPCNLTDEADLECAEELPEFVAIAEAKRPEQPDVEVDNMGNVWICLRVSDTDVVDLQACELFGFG